MSNSDSKAIVAASKAVVTVSGLVDNKTTDTKTLEWMAKCPNPQLFIQKVQEKHWLDSKQKCHECNDKICRRDLRVDIISPYQNGELICQQCWEFFLTYDTCRMKHQWKDMPVPTPLSRVTKTEKFDRVELIEKSTKRAVGFATGYNPVNRMADMVTLYGMEDCAEPGIVDNELIAEHSSKPKPVAMQEGESTDEDDEDDS